MSHHGPLAGSAAAARRGASADAAVFWLLIVLGVGTFAPCIIVPEWRAFQAAKIAEQHQRHRVDVLRSMVEQERRQLDAVQNDPTVVARLAQRDLGFIRPGEIIVAVPAEDPVRYAALTELEDSPFTPRPVEPPAWFASTLGWLPKFNYDAVFCDPATRTIIMLMSLSLIVAAVVLFQRRTPKPAAPRALSG